MTNKLKEDTVSADRKERIIFDPDAWRKSDKSGKKTSAITSRQNFDNEKFTRKAKEEQVDEGLQQTLRKYVPGYAKKQIDKKMDAGKFGKDDVDKDANYWRYKKVQDKLKKEEVEQIDEISLDLAKRARDKAEHMVDMDYDDLRDKPYGHSEKQRVKFQKYVDKKEAKKNVKEEVELDEGTIQPSGDSKVDSAGPTQSDTIAQDKKIKKSNNPQIEFVTGTASPNGSSSTSIGNAQNMGIKKISEALIEKAIKQVKGKEDLPFDPDTSAEKEFKKPNNPNRSPMDTVRALAQKAMKKQQTEACKDDKKKKKQLSEEELEEGAFSSGKLRLSPQGQAKFDATHKATKSTSTIRDKDEKGTYTAVREKPAGSSEYKEISRKYDEGVEMTGKLAYAQFVEQLDELVEFVVEETVDEDYGWDYPEPKKSPTSNVRRVQGTRYGGSKQADDNADEDWYSKKEKPEAKAEPEAPVKRGRGRPAGSYGTYKARSAETKAAAAAKSAATKAANKAK